MISSPRFLIAGQLNRDYLIPPSGEPIVDTPGGSVLYAAVGHLIWDSESPTGIISRVGEDFPQKWLDKFSKSRIDTRGVTILPHELDLRRFIAYTNFTTKSTRDPVSHFSRIGKSIPKKLLGYQDKTHLLDSRIKTLPTSLRQGDIPSEYFDASAVHFCPLDYLSHSLLPAILRRAEFPIITLDPSPGYMNPTFWDDIPALITGLTAFVTSEANLRFLFQARSSDLWEMAEAIASFGCEIVIVKCGQSGQRLYDAESGKRWDVPQYPVEVVDPTGMGDAFCGGFLAGYQRTYNPLEAVLFGNVSASLVGEGSGAFFALDALPGLASARLESLREDVKSV